jgi:hypothetical protein
LSGGRHRCGRRSHGVGSLGGCHRNRRGSGARRCKDKQKNARSENGEEANSIRTRKTADEVHGMRKLFDQITICSRMEESGHSAYAIAAQEMQINPTPAIARRTDDRFVMRIV